MSPDNYSKLKMEGNGNLVLSIANLGLVWESMTASGTGSFANFQGDGNLVVYNAASPPVFQWQSGTTGLAGGAQGIVLYLPGPSSECECTQYMCIIVQVPAGGAKTSYYAVTNGAFFETLASCPTPN